MGDAAVARRQGRRPLRWEKSERKLRAAHGWRAKPGYKIFVADRGAVRFNFPADWTVEPGADSTRFHDRQPPKDDCLLQVSYLYLNPAVDWSSLPLDDLLADVVQHDERKVIPRGEAVHVWRTDLELAWIDAAFHDPVERREACSRSCFARGSNIQAFITMDFWPEDAKRFLPVWDQVLETLRLGQFVADPTRGPNKDS